MNATYRMVVVGLAPAGAALGGVLGDSYGLRMPYLVALVVLAVSVPLFWKALHTGNSCVKR